MITGAFVMAAAGAYYLLERKFAEEGAAFLRVAVIVGVLACAVQIFPTGDIHGRMLHTCQPVTTAAMEGLFRSQAGAPIVILGQPDAESERIDNPLVANKVLSFLLYGRPTAQVKGLNEFPKTDWPTNIPLLRARPTVTRSTFTPETPFSRCSASWACTRSWLFCSCSWFLV